VARVAAGGTIVIEQANPTGDRWAYSALDMNLNVRVAMVKTIPMVDKETATEFRPLPAAVSFQDAVRELLAMPVPLR